MIISITHWIIFNLFVLGMLALDLGVFHRHHHKVSFKEAVTWTVVWIALALAFNGWIFYQGGAKPGMEFLTGYLIEKSLSVDNIFVFLVIFTYFKVPEQYQHKVLFWGIIGALLMRAAFIAAGIALLKQFHGLIYVFGALLILTGIKLWTEKGKEMHPEKNPLIRLFQKLMPVSPHYDEDKFFTKMGIQKAATPLFIALLTVEITDLIFAVDSIPAILAITQDPFIVYTSNVFAILGLRSLYFALAGFMSLFHLLHYGLAVILMFVGTKMMLVDIYKIPIVISLGVVCAILFVSVIASVMFKQKQSH